MIMVKMIMLCWWYLICNGHHGPPRCGVSGVVVEGLTVLRLDWERSQHRGQEPSGYSLSLDPHLYTLTTPNTQSQHRDKGCKTHRNN